VQDREEHGAFSSKEDLMRVSGIGEKKYAKLEANICV
jgi:competence protein ComEA